VEAWRWSGGAACDRTSDTRDGDSKQLEPHGGARPSSGGDYVRCIMTNWACDGLRHPVPVNVGRQQ
jgi:hypothetical protein